MRKIARITVPVGIALALPFASIATAEAAPPGGWGPIIKCESSGNPQATNGSHFGLFQFDLRTWQSVGGKGNPMNASVAEQTLRADILHASRGTQPWLASKGCWQGKSGAPQIKGAPAVPAPTPKKTAKAKTKTVKPVTPKKTVAPVSNGNYKVKKGDTLSKIAARNGTTWQALHKMNPNIKNPNMIFVGQNIHTP